jgi:hypothetical protein
MLAKATLPAANSAPRPAAWFSSDLITRLLATTWVGLLLLRLALLGRGALADYDERRYYQSFDALRAAAHGDWQACCYALSMTAARPVDALWRCLPAAGQLVLARYAGWDVHSYPSLLLPTLLNWAATVLAAWYFFRICRLLLADVVAPTQWALVAAVLYASLANTSLYVRHVLPYDGAMLLFFWLLFQVLRQRTTPVAWFWAKLGVGAGLLWLFYPGYYAGPVLLVAPLLDWQRPVAWVLAHIRQLLALGISFAGPLLAAEVMSRLGGAPPFWAVSYDLSLHILQGAPSEGYSFLFSYLWHVENTLGVIMLALLALALVQVMLRLSRTQLAAWLPHTPRQKVLAAAAMLFLVHATAAAEWHRIVWYGRLLHLYFPFMVLAGVAALASLRRSGWAAGVGLSSCLVGVTCYGLFFVGYRQIAYPPDIIAAYHLNCLPARQLRYYTEVRVPENLIFRAQAPHAAVSEHCPPAAADSLTILVNFALLYPPNEATRVVLPTFKPAVQVLFDAPHYYTFSAYQFEGQSPAERVEVRKRKFRLRVLRAPNSPR